MIENYKLNEKITLKNNIVLAPITTASSNDDLTISDDEIKFWGERAKEVGIVITGCTFYSEEGQGFENEFYGGSDEFIPSLKKLADSIKAQGAKAILQIFHVGRMGLPSKELVSASAIKANHNSYGEPRTPRELTNKEVWELIDGFYHTTRRAIEAGFDGIEIHGANTYLIQQFFSPHSNRRDDEFGGSLEKRMRLPLELIKVTNRAKEEFASDEFIIGYRFSPEELETPGITLDDTLTLVNKLADEKLDYLHASLKSYDGTSIRDNTDKRVIGKLLKETINGRKPLIGVGSIHSKEDLQEAINEVGYDMIAVGTSLIIDKKWLTNIENGITPNRQLDFNNLEEQAIPLNLAKRLIKKSLPNWLEIK